MDQIIDEVKDKAIDIDVARLDGYLTGIVALNGQINEYYAGAYLIKNSYNENIESSLVNHYAQRCQITFSNIKQMGTNLSELEFEIQDLTVKDVLGYDKPYFNPKDLLNRKKYISFKIVDMIGFLISDAFTEPCHKVNVPIHKIEANLSDTNADYIFFCISFENNILVLQFKHKENKEDGASSK